MATVAVVMGVILSGQQSASAETWAFGHGWQGNRSLVGTNYATAGKAVGLWKNILVATFGCGAVPMPSAPGAQNWYGNAEQWYTTLWQQKYNVPNPDGVVGPNSWAAARWYNLKRFYVDGDYEYYVYIDAFTRAQLPFAFRRFVPWDGWQVDALWNPNNGSLPYFHQWVTIDDSTDLDDLTWLTICR
jgi:hypothetical protein